jgi:hypothetical protein
MDATEIMSIFLPHLLEAGAGVMGGKRLVHYTSAEAAFRIITGKQIWLRNANLMNDYSEMRHGLTCLQNAWASPAGVKLQGWLDSKSDGLKDEVLSTFDSHSDSLTNATFLMSLSEHDDDEDLYGRLSMWRAYGGRAGVALVLNPTMFLSESDEMGVYSAPVVYRDIGEFVNWFEGWVDNIIAAESRIQILDRATLAATMFYAFRTFVLATKHPGFREEKEWRVFHSPNLDAATKWASFDVEIVNGTPQHLVKVNLFDDESVGVIGVGPASLINRVIIGPCESPLPIRNAIGYALDRAEVPDYANKIWMSFIPLRQR